MRQRFVSLVVIVTIGLLVQTIESDAEDLIASLSSEEVLITSNFSGEKVTVFAQISRDKRTVSRAEPYRVAVSIIGPQIDVVTRKKSPFLGVWVNRASATYVNVPSFYAINLSDPLNDMALQHILQQEQVGIQNLHLAEIESKDDSGIGDDEFRSAFLRLKQEQGYYSQKENAIEFLTPTLFRTTIELPGIVPVGEYKVFVHLFRGGAMLSKKDWPLTIAKTGFGQYTYDLAHFNSWIYGIAIVVIAVIAGYLASVIFRKD